MKNSKVGLVLIALGAFVGGYLGIVDGSGLALGGAILGGILSGILYYGINWSGFRRKSGFALNAKRQRVVAIGDKKALESQCHYPDCSLVSVKICRKCHQSFCGRHMHRRWGRSLCEFCLLLQVAKPSPPLGDIEAEKEVATIEGLRHIQENMHHP